MSENEVKVDKALNNRFYVKFMQLEIGLLYKNSKEHNHAGLPETKFSAKYLKICATKYAP